MLFKDIIGQNSVKNALIDIVAAGRMPHATLLLGNTGSGSLAIGLGLAQFLLCNNRSAHDACGECNHCRKASKMIHPDLHFSYPTVGTNKLSTDFLVQWRQQLAKNPYLDVNKWLLAATILIVVVNVGLYFWMSSDDSKEINQKPVVKVNLENSPFHEFIKEARVGNNTFFGVVGPNWASLPQEKQEDILKKIYGVGGEKGFSKAQLLNSDGKTVAYIDSQGSQIY